MTAAEAAMYEGLLRDQYREAVRHDYEIRAQAQRTRLKMYALRLAHDPSFLASVESEGSVTGEGQPAAEVLAPFYR